MEKIFKHINDTNASYRKIGAGDAKNTDLFLDNEHYDLFKDCGGQVTVRFSKTNLTQAILFIASILPRKFDQSAEHKMVEYSNEFVYEQLCILDALFQKDGHSVDTFTQVWNVRKDVPKKNGEIDNRFYFNGLLMDVEYVYKGKTLDAKFTVRNYLAGGYSNLTVEKAKDGIFDIFISNDSTPRNDETKRETTTTTTTTTTNKYRPFITAIKTKPFLLLAGISGTGKSRIVRELARACWEVGSEEYEAQKPRNFEMVQVKPNWHDSTELLGYVSRVSGTPEFISGDFLRFIVKAWEEPDVPYFLCLDEMNLAPVEQYFAEYLSVIESRKAKNDGKIVTDPIVKKVDDIWYSPLTFMLTEVDALRKRFNSKDMDNGICLPQNLVVIGTVNMDETTYSFSRKVLDRAMTIEMNEFDIKGGLEREEIAIDLHLNKDDLIGTAVEGKDVYSDNKEVCEIALNYLSKVNEVLKDTPFAVAYRTRNEFLLYVVNNLPYNKDEEGNDLPEGFVIARALDEITSMKMLSRIEGDDTKVSERLLSNLHDAIDSGLKEISSDGPEVKSISLAKIDEMTKRLKSSGYTSYWS